MKIIKDMKRYNSPKTTICPLYYSSSLCAGSSPAPVAPRVTGIVHGGNDSGDVAGAF